MNIVLDTLAGILNSNCPFSSKSPNDEALAGIPGLNCFQSTIIHSLTGQRHPILLPQHHSILFPANARYALEILEWNGLYSRRTGRTEFRGMLNTAHYAPARVGARGVAIADIKYVLS